MTAFRQLGSAKPPLLVDVAAQVADLRRQVDALKRQVSAAEQAVARAVLVEDYSAQPCFTADLGCSCPTAHLHVDRYCVDLHVEPGGTGVYLTDGEFEREVTLPFSDLRFAQLAAIAWATAIIHGAGA